MIDRCSSQAQSMFQGQVASPLGAMATLLGLGGLSGCPLEIVRALEGMGWNVQRLGTLHDAGDEMIGVVLQATEEKLGKAVDVQILLGLIEVCQAAAEVAWKVEGKTSGAELLVAHEQKRLQEKMNEWRKFTQKVLVEKVPLVGTAKVIRWPTKLQRRLNEAGDNPALRDSAERTERNRWIYQLKRLLQDGGCPSVRDETMGFELSRRYGKGRRVNTLRKHVKTWQKVSEWTMATFRRAWPAEPSEFARYLECRANEPCGRTVPDSVYRTLIFMENAGEIPPEEQLNKSPAVRNVLEEVNMQLSENSGGVFTKRAWHLPVKVIAEFETVVMDEKAKEYVRCYAWFRLVKTWTGMRFSDTCGLLEETMELQSFGLTAVLAKTKTTGPGKKVQKLRIWVNVMCWIRHRHWLEVGFDLWKKLGREAGLQGRDFALPCPTRDLSGFTRRMAKYGLASKCSQALFNDLNCEYDGAVVPLLPVGAGLLWTEHSERATIRTWADAVGIRPEVKKQMGRWMPSSDQAYERTWRANVLRAQEKIASFIRNRMGGKDVFDEAAVFSAMASKLEEMGLPPGAAEVQIDKLMVFGKGPVPKRVRLTPNGAVFESDDEGEAVAGFGDDGVYPSGPLMGYESMSEDDAGDLAAGEAEVREAPTHGTYVLSIVCRGQTKTLHRIGECHRVPGIHYSRFEVVGDNPPPASEFHRSCRLCFPRGTGAGEESSGEAEDGEVSSSDSSTSVEESSD